LSDCAVTGEVWCDSLEGDAAVARDGPCRAEQFSGVDAVVGELNDVDVVTPAGASDATFKDRDALTIPSSTATAAMSRTTRARCSGLTSTLTALALASTSFVGRRAP
jgi:hypothetical protein